MMIYVCAPYDGSEETYNKTLQAMQYVADEGHTPVSPYAMLHLSLDHQNAAAFEQTIQAALKIIEVCDQVWVFGVEKELPPNDYKFKFTKAMVREFIRSRSLKKQFRDCTEVM